MQKAFVEHIAWSHMSCNWQSLYFSSSFWSIPFKTEWAIFSVNVLILNMLRRNSYYLCILELLDASYYSCRSLHPSQYRIQLMRIIEIFRVCSELLIYSKANDSIVFFFQKSLPFNSFLTTCGDLSTTATQTWFASVHSLWITFDAIYAT